MQPTTMDKAGAAADLVKPLELAPEAKKLLQPTHSPRLYVATLVGAGFFVDAVRVLAHALPRREGVWWAIQCVKTVPSLAEEDHAPVLASAEAWVLDPNDEKRRAAFAMAEKAGFSTPAACAANAAFFSGGSISPAGNPVVEAPPTVAPGAIANAVILAAVATEPEKAAEKYANFLGIGEQVASGANRWSDKKGGAAPAPRQAFAAPPAAASPPPPPPPPPRSYY